jgi:hypothetical protein
MTIGRWGTVGVLALVLAGCGAEGGELREATERRRAAEVAEEPGAPAPAGEDTAAAAPERLPAFVLDEPGGEPASDPLAADTGRPATTPPADDAGSPWTAGIVEVGRSGRAGATLTDVRVGVNAGFDRVVLELTGDRVPAHRVEYVDRPVRECGSGRTVPIAGDGWLAVTLHDTRAHTEAGRATVERRNRRVDMPVLRQIVFTCDFEGEVQVVLGVSSPNPFRVTELTGPARLVVDVRQ